MNKKPRVALCLNGKVGNLKNKSGDGGAGAELVLDLAYKHWYEYLIKNNNVDVFIWSWDEELKENIATLFNPVKQVYCKQINFLTKHRKTLWQPYNDESSFRIQSHYSRYYSLNKCVKLKSQYEKEHNFKYDIVFCSRFDLCLKREIKIPEWNHFIIERYKENMAIDLKNLDLNSKIYKKLQRKQSALRDCIVGNGGPAWGKGRFKIQDHYFFSSSRIMDKYAELYNHLDNMSVNDKVKRARGISSHRLSALYIMQMLGLKLYYATIEHHKLIANQQEASIVRALYFNWTMGKKRAVVLPIEGRLVNIKLTPDTHKWETFKIEDTPIKKQKNIEYEDIFNLKHAKDKG